MSEAKLTGRSSSRRSGICSGNWVLMASPRSEVMRSQRRLKTGIRSLESFCSDLAAPVCALAR